MIVIDGQDASTPLNIETIGRDQFKGLKVFDRWQVQPSLQNTVQDETLWRSPHCVRNAVRCLW